jgi:hypothetical protein
MNFSQDQIDELKQIAPSLQFAEEGGYPYFLIEKLKLPEGCVPGQVDALLLPIPQDGYHSRLFFSQQVTGCPTRNWNKQIRVLDRNWYAISWQTTPGLKLSEQLMIHLKALRT